MLFQGQGVRVFSLLFALVTAGSAWAHDGGCEAKLSGAWSLESFFAPGENNFAVQHPFTVMNAAERNYALIMHVPPREALDPLHKIKRIKIYPTLAGEDPATGGRMVVGQEESVAAFVSALHSIARGDRSGKSLGFPGPAGTGKTELFYVLYNLQKNLSKEDKYKPFSYRWKNLFEVPKLRSLFRFDREGKPIEPYFDPDLARSPFTLLREDMQDEVLNDVMPRIRSKWGVTISEGWRLPEPKSAAIIKAIFEHEFPQIATGQRTIDDLSREEYLGTLGKYLVIVPKVTIRPMTSEPTIIRTQNENANFQALMVTPNVARAAFYGYNSAFGVDYTGVIFRQEELGLLMTDELFRNPPDVLNMMLELIQNHMAASDFGDPVQLDIVPVWNSNDESIEQAHQNHAIRALLNRTDSPSMRSLLPVNQIEAVMPFQIGQKKFKMRRLNETEAKPFNHAEVYPPTDAQGVTQTAHGRYALYYDMSGQQILIAPYALNYMAWLASATRYVTDLGKVQRFTNELNIIRANPGLLTDPIERVKIDLGDRMPEKADLAELAKVRHLVKEGSQGISARHIESWLKKALEIAGDSGRGVLTPLMVDMAFNELIVKDDTFKPEKDETRAKWQQIRERVKIEILLPRLDAEVQAIVSGDMSRAERMYDEVEQEFIALATDANAKKVIPEDNGEHVAINFERLEAIRKIYRSRFGKDFQPTFLLRQVAGSRKGGTTLRDPELLESIRVFLADQNALVMSHIGALHKLYQGNSADPAIRQRDAEIQPLLASYGYDQASFHEAVALVYQLQQARKLAKEQQR